MNVLEELFKLRDPENALFQAKLTPTIDSDTCLGVRVPKLREFAKAIKGSEIAEEFIKELPHKYYDENMLHSILLADYRDYEKCVRDIEAFLPYVDNWAVCDTLRPNIFKKHKQELLPKINEWVASEETYTSRFGIKMLMNFYLNEDFSTEYLELVANKGGEDYYLRMMKAWYFATALAFQWDDTIKIIEDRRLDDWTHRKTIQKACESYRVSDERKCYLKSLK